MNFSLISYIIGWVLDIEAAFLLMSGGVGLLYGERSAMSFFISAAVCLIVGSPLIIRKPKRVEFYARDGLATVAICWMILSIFGSLPFFISGEIPRFIDALFETVSGFTTTGSSVVSDVEGLSHCIIFWRSFTHWIGGMGVLVFLLAVIPLAGGSKVFLMRAESPGPSVSKLVPKTRYTALILYGLYIFLSVLQFFFLIAGKMPVFDAINTTFATAGTGGFGIKNDSLASYSPYIQWVVSVFMMLFGINFNLFFLLIMRKWRLAFKSEEVKTYFAIIFCATALITCTLCRDMSLADSIRTAFFQVTSIITTTGFATVDFNLWATVAKTILVMLMFIGACAGSTGGGFKISRIIILFKRVKVEIRHFLNSNSVSKIRIDGKILDGEVIHATGAFLMVYVFLFAISVLLISFGGHSTETCFTAVAATFNNIGPGLSDVGPTANFGFFSDFSKTVLIFDMLAGRLELFPLLILFCPSLWVIRRNHEKH